MRGYSTVLFDLDGTLLDSIDLIVDSFHHTFATFGLPARSDAAWLSGIGTPLRGQLAPWAANETMLDAMVDAYRAYTMKHHDARVRAFPGIGHTVGTLAARGVRLGVVTSKNRPGTLRGLAAAGLEGLWEVLVCAEDVAHPKPHREPVDRAVALLGGAPETTLFVGDSLHDLIAGHDAGVATGAALWGPFRREHLACAAPSYWLDHPHDVLRVAGGA